MLTVTIWGGLNRLAADFRMSTEYKIPLPETITLNELVIYFNFRRILIHLPHLDVTGHFETILEVVNQRLNLESVHSDTTFTFPPINEKQYIARETFTSFDDSSSVNMSFVEIRHEAKEGEKYTSLIEPKEPVAHTHYILKKRIQQHLTTDGRYFETWEADPYFDAMNYSSPNPQANLL